MTCSPRRCRAGRPRASRRRSRPGPARTPSPTRRRTPRTTPTLRSPWSPPSPHPSLSPRPLLRALVAGPLGSRWTARRRSRAQYRFRQLLPAGAGSARRRRLPDPVEAAPAGPVVRPRAVVHAGARVRSGDSDLRARAGLRSGVHVLRRDALHPGADLLGVRGPGRLPRPTSRLVVHHGLLLLRVLRAGRAGADDVHARDQLHLGLLVHAGDSQLRLVHPGDLELRLVVPAELVQRFGLQQRDLQQRLQPELHAGGLQRQRLQLHHGLLQHLLGAAGLGVPAVAVLVRGAGRPREGRLGDHRSPHAPPPSLDLSPAVRPSGRRSTERPRAGVRARCRTGGSRRPRSSPGPGVSARSSHRGAE